MFYFDKDNGLAYIDSQNINVFPSGRRKGELEQKGQYVPFDPEARLNTEANHRKHSGLNGYKQSYLLDWDAETGVLPLVVNGYLFNIKFVSNYINTDTEGKKLPNWTNFANALANGMGWQDIDSIYVNILTTDVILFSDPVTNTEILADQAFSKLSDCLDILKDSSKQNPTTEDFYFAGLSFSAKPLEDIKTDLSTAQHPVFLQLLSKDASNNWHLYEPSKLPVINHGDTNGSVEIPGDLKVTGNLVVDNTITAKEVSIGGMNAITLEVVETCDGKWQLQFHTAHTDPAQPLE